VARDVWDGQDKERQAHHDGGGMYEDKGAGRDNMYKDAGAGCHRRNKEKDAGRSSMDEDNGVGRDEMYKRRARQ
jgi:hypothetical protein